MRLQLISWNGHNINDDSNYNAIISPGNSMPSAIANFLDMGGATPRYINKTIGGGYLTFFVIARGNIEQQRDELNEWFGITDTNVGTLLAEDLDNPGDTWHVKGYTITPPLATEGKPSQFAITLALNPVAWIKSTSDDTEFNITTSTETNSVTAGGNLKTNPVITITPKYEKGAISYRYRFFVAVHPPSIGFADLTNVKPYFQTIPVDLTPTGWDTAAIVTAGDMLPSGNDIRVIVNGIEQPRWFGGGGINSADTHVWTYLSMSSYTEMSLKTALDNSTTPTSIEIECYGLRTAAFDKVPSTLLIGSEIISYSQMSIETISATPQWSRWRITFSGLVRGVHESSKATHALDDEVHQIANEVWIVYNDPDAAAPDEGINDKPPFDLVNSTNSLWIYDGVFSVTGANSPLGHSQTPIQNGPGTLYTDEGNDGSLEGNFSDPWEVVGLKLKSILISGIAYSDTTSKPTWKFVTTTPIDSVQYSGRRYRSGSQSGVAYVGYPSSGKQGGVIQLAILAEPSTTAVWENFSDTVNYPNIAVTTFLVTMSGGLGTTLPLAESLTEINNLEITPRYPVVVFTPTAIINASYTLSGYIENSVNGHRINFRNIPMLIDMVLTIDCENMTAEMSDGREMRPYLQFDGAIREEWMELEPGENPIVFYDEDTSDVDVVFSINYRNTI